MREIKFRAWDKLKRQIMTEGVMDNLFMIIGQSNDYELMQFTGLKDKNGKEIFEGDVLKFKFTDCEKDKENFIIVECIFEYGRFVMCDSYKDSYSFDEEKVEVIGNIYENPELLEEK